MDKSLIEELLRDMRIQVSWSDKATMPIPLYERMKAVIQAMGDASFRKDEGRDHPTPTTSMDDLHAAELLYRHNIWRRGDETYDMASPKELGIALDAAISALRERGTSEVKRRGYPDAVEALQRLVSLKDYKDAHGKDGFYEFEQLIAWRMAKQALAGDNQRGYSDDKAVSASMAFNYEACESVPLPEAKEIENCLGAHKEFVERIHAIKADASSEYSEHDIAELKKDIAMFARQAEEWKQKAWELALKTPQACEYSVMGGADSDSSSPGSKGEIAENGRNEPTPPASDIQREADHSEDKLDMVPNEYSVMGRSSVNSDEANDASCDAPANLPTNLQQREIPVVGGCIRCGHRFDGHFPSCRYFEAAAGEDNIGYLIVATIANNLDQHTWEDEWRQFYDPTKWLGSHRAAAVFLTEKLRKPERESCKLDFKCPICEAVCKDLGLNYYLCPNKCDCSIQQPTDISVKREGKCTQLGQPEDRGLAARGAEAFGNEVPASPATGQPVDTSGQHSNLDEMNDAIFIVALKCAGNPMGENLMRKLCLEAAKRLEAPKPAPIRSTRVVGEEDWEFGDQVLDEDTQGGRE